MQNVPCRFRCLISRPSVFTIATLLLLAAAGCAPQNPHEAKIDAATPEKLGSWLMFNASHLPADEIGELNTCINEIKMHLRATGRAQVDERLCSTLDGKPLKWVFLEGYRLRIESLKKERRSYYEDLKYKDTLRTRPGDTASADYLEHQKELRRGQFLQFTANINKAVDRYNELLEKFHMPGPKAEPVTPDLPKPPVPPETGAPDPARSSPLDELPTRIN